MHLKSRISATIAGLALLAGTVVVPALAQQEEVTPPTTDSTLSPESNAPEVPLRGTVVGNEIVYPDGVSVSLDAGTGLSPNEGTGASSQAIDLDSVPRATVIPCSRGYTCLYQNANYGGRRLQWSRPGLIPHLRYYGFNDEMSSWINRNTRDARWYYDANSRGPSRCMNAGTSNRYVGWTDNDEASSLRIYTNSRACS